MKCIFRSIFILALMFANCAADSVDTFDINDPDNFEQRIYNARISVEAAIMILPQIQERIHTDPEQVSDLVGKCWKYLINAKNILDIEDENDMD